jgi:hypothetical protein
VIVTCVRVVVVVASDVVVVAVDLQNVYARGLLQLLRST